MKEYIINGIKFTQEEIVGKQYVDIMRLIGNVSDVENGTKGFVALLGVKIMDFIDIFLKCEDKTIKKKAFLAENLKLSKMEEIVDDFFSYNDLSSLLGAMVKSGMLTVPEPEVVPKKISKQ